MHLHAEVRQVILKQRGHLHALRIGGTCDDGELDSLAGPVEELTLLVPGEARRFQQLARRFGGACGMGNGPIEPELIAGADISSQWSASCSINQAHDCVSVDGHVYGLAEFEIALQCLPAGNGIELLSG